MASVRFVLNADADIESGADAAANHGKTQGKLDQLLGRVPPDNRGLRKRIASASPRNPLSVAATGTFVMDFGSPPAGSMWWLQEVVVAAGTGVLADAYTAVTGAFAVLFIGRPPAQTANNAIELSTWGGLLDLQRPGIGVPGVFGFSGEAIPVHDTESVYVVMASPNTAVLQYGAIATVFELSADATMLNRIPWSR